MTRMPGKQALIEQLIADGTRYVFGNPGTTEQGFMDALQDYPQLEFILALHEGVAVGVADAYARATRKPAFVELHIAPGLGNAMGMLYDAARGHSPLIVYAGQSDTHSLDQEPLLSGDLVRMAEPLCKWAVEAKHAHDVPMLLRRAMKVAADPPPGPVFLSLPLDVLDQTAEMRIAPTSYTRTRSRPDAETLREAAAMLAGARHPVIVVGDGVAISGAQDEVGAIASLLGAPINAGYASEMNLPAGHPLAGLPLNVVSGAAVRSSLEAADVILIVGTPVFRTIFPAQVGPLPEEARVIQIDLDTWELAKNAPVELALAADPRTTLAELLPLIEQLMTAEQREEAQTRGAAFAEQRRAAEARLRGQDEKRRDQMPIAVTRLMQVIGEALPPNAAIFDESVTSGVPLQRYLRLEPGGYFRARGGGLGPGMPGTVGLKLAYPDRPVVGIVADGSAMYTITALWTAAHHKIPVTWVIVNNSSYRILKLNLQDYLGESGAKRRFMHTDLHDPPIGYDRLAESMGVWGRRVERPEDLGDALREAMAQPGPSLLDVVVDPAVPGRVR
jgi:thiamine pyrophosphate-dependent acetolactate synthase large subunit-like protein